jgi:hypothetical protein
MRLAAKSPSALGLRVTGGPEHSGFGAKSKAELQMSDVPLIAGGTAISEAFYCSDICFVVFMEGDDPDDDEGRGCGARRLCGKCARIIPVRGSNPQTPTDGDGLEQYLE